MNKWSPVGHGANLPTPGIELDARQLHRRFEDGDMLAPFECCAIWTGANLDSASLPGWVIDYFCKIAAKYYNKGPRHQGRRVSPKRLIEMTRVERKGALPSFDKMAGLVGGSGTPGAWLQKAETDRNPFVQAYLDDLMNKRDQGERVYLKTKDRERFPAFTEQGPSKGQFRSEALDLIASWFRIKGHDGKNRARTMRHRFRMGPVKTDK